MMLRRVIGLGVAFLLTVLMVVSHAHHRPGHGGGPGGGGTPPTATVVLCLRAMTDPSLAYRIVSYGTASGAYSTTLDIGLASNVSIGGLQTGQTYYFIAHGYNEAGRLIGYSNELLRTT